MYSPHNFLSFSTKSTHPWIESTRFEEKKQAELLREILGRVRKECQARVQHGGKPIKVVFDLDSTVFDVKPRTLRILKEFAQTKEAQAISAKIAAWSLGLPAHKLLYTLGESARANGVPDEASQQQYIKAAFQFWLKHFFTHEYLMVDHPTPGAVDYVRAVVDAGAVAVYLTGRDWPGMGKGTRSMLEHWGFPMGVEEGELLMKPSFGQDDSEFKDEALRELRIHSEAVAFFDNEPANFFVFEKNFPEAHLVFFHSNCSTKEARPVRKIHRIENFLF